MSEAKELTLQETAQQLQEVLQRMGKTKKPAESDLALLRKLGSHPQLWRTVGDITAQAESYTIGELNGTPASKELLRVGARKLREELGYDASGTSEIERLLIDAVVLTWLRWGACEHAYTTVMNAGDGPTLTRGAYWERKLTLTHGRFLKSVETLAKVRRLLHVPNVQVNIAAAGGQQVNVAG